MQSGKYWQMLTMDRPQASYQAAFKDLKNSPVEGKLYVLHVVLRGDPFKVLYLRQIGRAHLDKGNGPACV